VAVVPPRPPRASDRLVAGHPPPDQLDAAARVLDGRLHHGRHGFDALTEVDEGRLLTAEAEGRGYATEAARALLPEALALLGPGRFVSYVDPANPRSARVAQKLGASRDPAAEAALAAAGPSQVWRHGGAA
jgi:RimJ/RimL family protein N-acetyltransferase